MEVYETIVIFKPNINKVELNGIKNLYREYLRHSGKKVYAEILDKKELAYKIKDYTEGNFIIFTYESEASDDVVFHLERRLRIDDNVLKYLSIRLLEEEAINKLYSKLKPEQNKIDAWDVLFGRAKYY